LNYLTENILKILDIKNPYKNIFNQSFIGILMFY